MRQPNLYEMRLHEEITLGNREVEFTVTRVPGGWIYHHYSYSASGTVFVPFDNEYQEGKSNG